MVSGVDARLLKATKFPKEFNQKVDMQKINVEVIKKWIAGRISTILGSEDDVVIDLCANLLEGERFPDIKTLQIQLTGFLDKDTARFCQKLWSLCLSAQESPQGVPKELLEAKKQELMQEKLEAAKAAEAAQKQQALHNAALPGIDSVGTSHRDNRGDFRGGRGRGGRSVYNNSDHRREGQRFSRSPSPRQRRTPTYSNRDDYRQPRRGDDRYRSSYNEREDGRRTNHFPRARSRTPPRRRHEDRPSASRYRNSEENFRHRRSPSPERSNPHQNRREYPRRRARSPSTGSSDRSRSRTRRRRRSRSRSRASSSRRGSISPAPAREERKGPVSRQRSPRPRSSSPRSRRDTRRHSPSHSPRRVDDTKPRSARRRPSSGPRMRDLGVGKDQRRDRLTPPSISPSRSSSLASSKGYRNRRHSRNRRRSRSASRSRSPPRRYDKSPMRRRRNTSSPRTRSPDPKRRKANSVSRDSSP